MLSKYQERLFLRGVGFILGIYISILIGIIYTFYTTDTVTFTKYKHGYDWLSYIDAVTYINLESRLDRRNELETTLAELGLTNVHRVEGVIATDKMYDEAVKRYTGKGPQMSKGALGCALAHINQLKLMYDLLPSNESYGVVLEDDFKVLSSDIYNQKKHELGDVIETYRPDIIMLGLTPKELDSIYGFYNVVKVHIATAAMGMIVKKSYIPKLMEIYLTGIKECIHIDQITVRYQKVDNWFGVFPPMFIQAPGYSNIEERYVDYHALEVDAIMLKDKNKFLNEI